MDKNLVNKPKAWVAVLCGAASLQAGQVQAACLGSGTLQTARTFYEHHYSFFSAPQPGTREAVTPGLLKLLEKEWACAAKGQLCAMEADPWLDAQDGDARDVRFAAMRDGRTVAVHYSFVLSAETRQPQTAQLRLARGGDGCWRVADLIGPEGRSLRQALANYYKNP